MQKSAHTHTHTIALDGLSTVVKRRMIEEQYLWVSTGLAKTIQLLVFNWSRSFVGRGPPESRGGLETGCLVWLLYHAVQMAFGSNALIPASHVAKVSVLVGFRRTWAVWSKPASHREEETVEALLRQRTGNDKVLAGSRA